MAELNNKTTKLTVSLCAPEYCPEVTVGQQEVIFTDDFGGKVKLTHEQFGILKDKITKGEL